MNIKEIGKYFWDESFKIWLGISVVCMIMIILMLIFTFIQLHQLANELSSYPTPLAEFVLYINKLAKWRNFAEGALLISPLIAVLYILFVLWKIIESVTRKELDKLFRISLATTQNLERAKAKFDKNVNSVKSILLFLLYVVGLVVFIALYRSELLDSYFSVMLIVLIIIAPMGIFFIYRAFQILKTDAVLTQNELMTYLTMSFFEMIIASGYLSSAFISIVKFTDLLSDFTTNLLWSGFHYRVQELAIEFTASNPEYFDDTDIFISALVEYALRMEVSSTTFIRAWIPDNYLHFIAISIIIFLGTFGFTHAVIGIQTFYGIKKTISVIILPALVGIVLFLVQYILSFPTDIALIFSISVVIVAILTTTIISNLFRKTLGIVCSDCNAINAIDHLHCSECGTRLDMGKPEDEG